MSIAIICSFFLLLFLLSYCNFYSIWCFFSSSKSERTKERESDSIDVAKLVMWYYIWHVCVCVCESASVSLTLCIVPLCNIVINWWTSTLNTPHGTTIIFYFQCLYKIFSFFIAFPLTCVLRERECVSCAHANTITTTKTLTKLTAFNIIEKMSTNVLIDKVELLSHLFSLATMDGAVCVCVCVPMSMDFSWGAKNFKDK